MNLADRIANKLGYRRTHWSDMWTWALYSEAERTGKRQSVEVRGYKITLSVKKIKKI